MPENSHASSKQRTFFQRAFSTLLLWTVVGLTFGSMQPWAHLALISLMAVFATGEFLLLSHRHGVKCHPIWGMTISIGYCAVVSWYYLNGAKDIPPFVDICLFFLLTAGSFSLQLRWPIEGTNTVLSVTSTILSVVWLTWMFLFTARIDFGISSGSATPGAFVLLWCLIVTKFADMGAYITGSLIGRHKMIPHISPAKTWEGFGGALFFGQLAACGLYALLPVKLGIFQSWIHVILLALIISLLAVLGDLAESLWKRSLSAKDSGHILPGIGGAMDLIDSICFTAPAVFLYFTFFL